MAIGGLAPNQPVELVVLNCPSMLVTQNLNTLGKHIALSSPSHSIGRYAYSAKVSTSASPGDATISYFWADKQICAAVAFRMAALPPISYENVWASVRSVGRCCRGCLCRWRGGGAGGKKEETGGDNPGTGGQNPGPGPQGTAGSSGVEEGRPEEGRAGEQ
ncbi:hypothetical protein DTO045G8_6707 [Paecilomyces variotii]|nr:hypothetical protein DTO045G8_6707 [Paecilomyces variotii]